MLLNYDFLERMEGSKVRAIDEKMKFLHCSNSIDRLILSYKMNPIKGSTIESTNLSRVVSKIKAGYPLGLSSRRLDLLNLNLLLILLRRNEKD
ncbi:hypothetical protein HPHPH34_0057 [Helicobacter pylori Hp H-34]|uniref:Uncharacterized protein n=1 Tax=Helicobacter pylori Hp H-34 TaxID=992069 RepID=J0PG38_HELPX|nr:hypothetical protein HPHPH34_0057 [Helicobacter pylori Hp H-34]